MASLKPKNFLKVIQRFPELVIILLMIVAVLLNCCVQAKISKSVLHREGQTVESDLPISIPMQRGEVFAVEMDVDGGVGDDFVLDIHPDDCVIGLKVNGIVFPHESYPGYCSWNKGFLFSKSEIERLLGRGKNHFHIELNIRNGGGLGGINATITSPSVVSSIISVIFFLLLGMLVFAVGKRFKIDRRLLLCFFIGLLLRVGYTQNTFYDERGHDVGGHLSYMQIIADQHKIPSAKECWSCYHPPVYYVAAAGTWNFAKIINFPSTNLVQWLDVLFSLVALAFGLACIKSLLYGNARLIAGLLWSVWPSFILASPRVGNDILFYAFYVVSLWGILSYLTTNKGKFFLTSILAAAFAYWTKSTGAIAFGIIGLVTLIHFVPRFFTKKVSKMEWASVGTLVAIGAIVGYMTLTGEVVGNSGGLDNSVLVLNKPGNFLYFDLEKFVTNPYIDPWHDELGRQYFWNYLAKTSLFGEFTLLNSDMGRWMACVASVCFILLAVFTVAGLWRKKWGKKDVLLVVQLVAFVAAMIMLRLKYPFSCSNDFRYIVPVLLSVLPYTAEGICGEGTSVKRRTLGWITVIVFSICVSVVVVGA
ncbi:MAG: glycosyltransferase family 39 protein [Fibrobacter sp.]|nr:glycosyltransferase family 39 protein [Fibrobacter sp.]